jgi:hypothetical protein
MGKVAAKTTVIGNSTMLGLRTVKLLNKFFVTLTAQRGSVILEVKSKLGPVGGMTLFARFFYRLMDILKFKLLFPVFVAAETEGQAVHGQQEFTRRGMRIMTHNTITPRYRSVNIVLGGHIVFMAGETDICQFGLCE